MHRLESLRHVSVGKHSGDLRYLRITNLQWLPGWGRDPVANVKLLCSGEPSHSGEPRMSEYGHVSGESAMASIR